MLNRRYDSYYVRQTLLQLLCLADFMTVIMLDIFCDSYYVRHILWQLLCQTDFMTVIMLDRLYDSYYVRHTLHEYIATERYVALLVCRTVFLDNNWNYMFLDLPGIMQFNSIAGNIKLHLL